MRIKQYVLIGALSTASLFALPMTTGYDAALEMATAYQKPVALLFTGSDWNAQSKALEIKMAESSFEELVGHEVLFVQVDYPEEGCQRAEDAAAHYALKQTYQIETFPTVVLLDPEHREIARTGLLPLSGKEFGLQLKRILKEYRALQTPSGNPEKDYFRAKKLGCVHLIDRYLQQGLAANRTSLLLLEAYRHVENKEEKEKWRAEILSAADPDSHVQLAMLDYQESQSVTDLEEALNWVSEKSSDYWKLHLMIAQHYMAKGENQTALTHARQAAERSPAASRVAILDMVDSFSNGE